MTHKLVEIIIDEKTIKRADSDTEHERAVAIFDIIEENFFQPTQLNPSSNPHNEFKLTIGMVEQKLVLNIESTSSSAKFSACHILSLSPLRQIVKDYFFICENYYNAIKTASPAKIETIDMARRGLHNEGAEILQSRLSTKIKIDFNTARKFFTLICMLRK